MPNVSPVEIGILWLALVGAAFAAKAQDGPGDLEAGHLLAREVCSPCHAIDPPPHAPRIAEIAPDFQNIANTPGMTATALRAFLLSSHPKMPNFILSREQSDDVITYILSLRERPQQGQGRPWDYVSQQLWAESWAAIPLGGDWFDQARIVVLDGLPARGLTGQTAIASAGYGASNAFSRGEPQFRGQGRQDPSVGAATATAVTDRLTDCGSRDERRSFGTRAGAGHRVPTIDLDH